jgi:phosphate starvation-inducible PhoH-like protein
MLFSSPNRRISILGFLYLAVVPSRSFLHRGGSYYSSHLIMKSNNKNNKKKSHFDIDIHTNILGSGSGYGLGLGIGSSSGNKNKNKPVYKPKGENQKKYCELLSNPDIPLVFGIGPAGCGKTLFACITAMNQYNLRMIDKIILTRPIIPVDEEDIGFLPGTMINKMDPWIRPIFDIFEEYYSKTELAGMLKSGVIEICPLAYMRGRTFKRSFIIADEMQNSSPNQMKMLATRLGEESKMVVMGDLLQGDRGLSNGLSDIIGRYNRFGDVDDLGIGFAMMNTGDIERSRLVVSILKLYEPGSGPGSGPGSKVGSLGDAALIPICDAPTSQTGKDFGSEMGV